MAWKPPEDELVQSWQPPADELISAPSPQAGKSLSLAEKASQFLGNTVQPGQSIISSAGNAVKEMFAPTADTLKRAINPNLGQAGILRPLEQAGQNVSQAVQSSYQNLPKPLQAYPPFVAANVLSNALTPTAFQQQAGAEAIGPALSNMIKGTGKGISVGSQMLTGTPATEFNKVVDRPEIYTEGLADKLTGQTKNKMQAIGSQIGEAAQNAGFTKEAVMPQQVLDNMNPKFRDFAGRQNPFEAKGSIAEGYFERVRNGENLTLPEVYDAYQAVNDVVTKTARKGDKTFAIMSKFQKSLQGELKDASRAYADAAALYEKAATGKKVTNILPRTQTGNVSQGRLAFNSLMTGGSLFLNPAAAVGTAALTSPLTHGGVAAGFGLAAKVAPHVARAIPSILRKYLDKNRK